MYTNEQFYIANTGNKEFYILGKMLNRHGLITGATGTGKTVSLQTLAETFSEAGIPVFATDIKGDLAGLARAGGGNSKVTERVKEFKLEKSGFNYTEHPVCFWDVFGKLGHPIRTTISQMGPYILSRLLDLNETQAGVLTLTFKIADDNGLLILDLKDLQKTLEYVGNNKAQFTTTYGNISAASIGAIQRGLLQLEQEGGEYFFGEPSLNILDFIQLDKGKGVVNILASEKLIHSPRIYAAFLLWMLSELYEQLPEVGDLEKPKIVFFFDEAHLLFKDAPKALIEKIEQTVRLIRSKAVGIYFVTQNPSDIPNSILGQLGNKIQHALRAFTPNDQKAVKAAANSFRPNPKFSTESVITELNVGEALVSFLDEKGAPQIVERAYILPPQGRIGVLSEEERNTIIRNSLLYGEYEEMIDRESAFEILQARQFEQQRTKEIANQEKQIAKETRNNPPKKEEKSIFEDFVEQLGKSTTRQVSNQLARTITRGILGSILGKR